MSDSNSSLIPVTQIQAVANRLRQGLQSVIFGQDDIIELLLVGILSEGHILLEGIPGTAKTTMVKTLAQLSKLQFQRVQLTPDMLPSEITGTSLYDLNSRSFSFRKGPIFTDLLLADEINRTPPKTQSALLEAMEEHQVTADGTRYELSPVFTVIATLNPVEFEGTYPLPEAQLDRFMMKLLIGYPSGNAEKTMLQQFTNGSNSGASTRFLHKVQLDAVTNTEEVLACRQAIAGIRVEESLIDYILQIVHDTRTNPSIHLGCSPRAALSLLAASRTTAAIEGKDFVTPDHVKLVTPAVLRHRLILTAEAELDGLKTDDVIRQTLNKIAIPR